MSILTRTKKILKHLLLLEHADEVTEDVPVPVPVTRQYLESMVDQCTQGELALLEFRPKGWENFQDAYFFLRN